MTKSQKGILIQSVTKMNLNLDLECGREGRREEEPKKGGKNNGNGARNIIVYSI